MINYEKTINDLILTFGAGALLFTHICKRLVQPLMLEPKESLDLIDNPRSGAWRSQELGNRIKESLGKDYTTFIGIAGRLHDRLMKFATNLDLDPANDLRPKWLSQSQTGRSKLRDVFSKKNKTWKGLKAGFENGSLEKALQQIEEDLRRLEWLLDGRDRELPMRKQRTRSEQTEVWNSVRDAARSIYAGLAAHWQCPPAHRHAVSLRLETRKVSDDNLNMRFGLILDLEHGGTPTQHVFRRDVEIEPKTTSRTIRLQDQPVTLGLFKISSISAAPQVQITHAQTTHAHPPNGAHIQDLCGWQQSLHYTSQESFGFLRHDVWQYHLYRGNLAHQISSSLSHMSLQDCLTGVCTTQANTPLLASGLGPKEK